MSDSHASYFDYQLPAWGRQPDLPEETAGSTARRLLSQPEGAAGVVALLLVGVALGTLVTSAWQAVRAQRNSARIAERLRWRERHQDGAEFVILPRPLDDPGPDGPEYGSSED